MIRCTSYENINDEVYQAMAEAEKPKYVVQMQIVVTVESPDARELDRETVVSCAMSAVSQNYERHVGQDHNVVNSCPWAKCHAEVTDNDCEIIEGIAE